MAEILRVGIIGASPERGWARDSHVPAVQGLDGLELAAVATRNQESADAAGAAFGVARAYGDPAALIADPDIDVVTVAAPVPAHRDLILAALRAGKHVVTEWPVTTSVEQTEEIAAIAAKTGLHTAVGLQSRVDPAARRALELIEAGGIGRVLSASVYSSTAGFGRQVAEENLYLEKPESGMNLMTIQTAHTVDFATMLAGRLSSLASLTTIQYPDLEVGEPPVPYRRTIADHVLLQARLADGGALAVEVAGGRPAGDTPFRMDVVGEVGALRIEGGAPRGFQSGVLSLSLNGENVEVDDGALASLADSAVNVARLYAALRDDIAGDDFTVPDFGHAVHVAHLVDDIVASAAG